VQGLTATGVSLNRLNVENTFVEQLPGDSSSSNVPRQVFGSLWSPVEPTPAGGEPNVIVYSREVCELLNLDPNECTAPEFALVMAGAAPFPQGRPYAQVRCKSLHFARLAMSACPFTSSTRLRCTADSSAALTATAPV
jgi:hypothetical protein